MIQKQNVGCSKGHFLFSFLYGADVPVVEGSSSQDDGVVVGPFRGVAPGALQGIPEVAPGRVAYDPLGEAPPYQEGKVHLREQRWNTLMLWLLFK